MGAFQQKQVTNRVTQSWFCKNQSAINNSISHSTKKFVVESTKFSLSNSKNETFIFNFLH